MNNNAHILQTPQNSRFNDYGLYFDTFWNTQDYHIYMKISDLTSNVQAVKMIGRTQPNAI